MDLKIFSGWNHVNIRKLTIITVIISILINLTICNPVETSTNDDISPKVTNSIVSSSSSVSSSSTGISSISSVGSSSFDEIPSIATKNYVPVTQIPKTITKRDHNDDEPKIKKTISIIDKTNHSREALSHEGSERDPVIYLSESSGYIPITSLRRPTAPSYPSLTIDPWQTWDKDYNRRYRFNNTRVQHIEAECQDDYMKIRIGFNGSFAGLLYSAGYAYDPDCMYINGSGRDYYEFYIQLNRCGTLGKNALPDASRKNPTKNFMWNTITVQYNPLIEEEFDEHFKVTCEYGYDFWKTVTFPILDVEVATGNPIVFTLSPPECYMEIRNGYGIAGSRVTGPVRVGEPLTLIIYMRSKYDGFDIVVSDCYAHNGANKKIQLMDENGCPVDDTLISKFRGSWSDTGVYETQVYAYMKTFRFTGSPALYIECAVRMCHGRCQSQPCHWRNVKNVVKRDVSNKTLDIVETANGDKPEQPTLSDNISLFQSLRVLQEGEGDAEEASQTSRTIYDANETCIKTSLLSTLTAGCCILLCILLGLLLVACAKLRYRKKESDVNNAYINHKGQYD